MEIVSKVSAECKQQNGDFETRFRDFRRFEGMSSKTAF